MPAASPTTTTSAATSGPLAGLRVAITRAPHQAEKQRRLLEEQGAQVFRYPTIAIVPPQDVRPLDAALKKAAAGEFDWLVLTSVNTIDMLADRMAAMKMKPNALKGLKVATVGSVTAEAAAKKLGVTVDLVPDTYTTDNLAAALNTPNARVLLPHSAIARPGLRESLRAAGAKVTTVDAYRNVVAKGGDPLPTLLWEGQVDAITFTSASTVSYFSKRLRAERGTLDMLDDVVVACIGPVTAEAARKCELCVSVVPEKHTIEGMVDSLAAHFARAKAH